MRSTKIVSRHVKATITDRLTDIRRWRRLRVPWKAILKELGLDCNVDTLSRNYKFRDVL